MCARYNSVTRGADLFGRHGVQWASPELSDVPGEIFPRYRGMVLRLREGALGLDVMTWTLLPFWSKDGDLRKCKHNFNARGETVDSLPSFRTPFRSRRCLVPVDAFTEFPQIDGRKVRHRVERADGEPMLFAGLWDRWSAKDGGEEVLSFTIVTTEPHDGLRWMHHPGARRARARGPGDLVGSRDAARGGEAAAGLAVAGRADDRPGLKARWRAGAPGPRMPQAQSKKGCPPRGGTPSSSAAVEA